MSDRYDINGSEDVVLPNKLGLTDPDAINQEEFVGFRHAREQAIDELTEETFFDLDYLYTLHQRALGHLYDFAGRTRTVNMSKDGFSFPAAEFLPQNLSQFEEHYLLPINEGVWKRKDALVNALASMHAELLYLHPFREGNGRIIRLFTQIIYFAKTGKELDLDLLNQGDNFARYVAAVQQAATGEHALMRELFSELSS